MTLLEGVIQKDFLSSNFETTDELLGSGIQTESVNIFPNAEMVSVLPWVPQTSSAVALRLMELDASIFYTLQQRLDSQKDKGAGNFIVSIVNYLRHQILNPAGKRNDSKKTVFCLFQGGWLPY